MFVNPYRTADRTFGSNFLPAEGKIQIIHSQKTLVENGIRD